MGAHGAEPPRWKLANSTAPCNARRSLAARAESPIRAFRGVMILLPPSPATLGRKQPAGYPASGQRMSASGQDEKPQDQGRDPVSGHVESDAAVIGHAALLAPGADVAIGRASGRGSVGQYV